MEQNKPDDKQMITIQQAAIILNIHPNTIRNYIEKGFLKSFALPTGKKIFLYEDEVKELIQQKHLKIPING